MEQEDLGPGESLAAPGGAAPGDHGDVVDPHATWVDYEAPRDPSADGRRRDDEDDAFAADGPCLPRSPAACCP